MGVSCSKKIKYEFLQTGLRAHVVRFVTKRILFLSVSKMMKCWLVSLHTFYRFDFLFQIIPCRDRHKLTELNEKDSLESHLFDVQ